MLAQVEASCSTVKGGVGITARARCSQKVLPILNCGYPLERDQAMACLSTQPLYLQLRSALVGRIATGEWGPGTAIPNESDLAREYGVSTGTIRKSLHLMESEHLI